MRILGIENIGKYDYYNYIISEDNIIGFLAEAIGLRGAFLVIAILGVSTLIQSNRLKKYL
jgi:hypothetical protein